MILYNQTRMGISYTQYQNAYLEGLAQRSLEILELGETALVGLNRTKGQLPKTNLPYVVSFNNALNTYNKTLVLADLTGVRDDEADLRYINTILTALWEDTHVSERYTGLRKFATKAYMIWVGRSLTNRFGLAYEDKMSIDILSAIYYYCAGGSVAEIFDPAKFRSYSDLAEITGLGAIRVKAVIDKFNLTEVKDFNLDVYVDCLANVSGDTKHKISTNSILATLAHSWYGEGGVFYCNLALEYPPMFLTLLYFAITDRTYSKTRLGVMVKEFAIGRNVQLGQLFTKQLSAIIKDINPKSPTD